MKKSTKRRNRHNLNRAQLLAVKALGTGHVLVVAGAGTGKTRVITWAVVYLVNKCGVRADEVLLLTFTTRAAREMVERVSKLLKGDASGPQGGTIHSFAARTLHRYTSLAGLEPGFTVLDPEDAASVIRTRIRELEISPRSLPSARKILDLFSAATNKGWSLKRTVWRLAPEYRSQVTTLKELRVAYDSYKREHNHLDFDDLLIELVDLLDTHAGVRERLRRRHRWLLVDEAQDLNGLQLRIIDLLAGDTGTVMKVGDPDQCIYSWRGAEPNNLRRFIKRYPDVSVVKLEENYRSVQPILDVANGLLEDISAAGFRKTLYTSRIGDGRPSLVAADSSRQEARDIADCIARRIAGGVCPSEVAVLYRYNRDPTELELELEGRKVPFVKFGGIRFRECAHVKDVIAHLRVVANPTDELALHRVLLLCQGVGRVTANRIHRTVEHRVPVERALRRVQPSTTARRSLRAVARLLDEIRPLTAPREMVRMVVTYYLKLPTLNLPDHRIRDLDRLIDIASRYDSLAAMLTEFTLEAPNRFGGADTGDDVPRVVLSTVHSAKGGEWDTVFVLQARDGRFPSDHIDADVDEERRLMYVAVTRAKNRLSVSWSGPLSPFIDTLPLDELFDRREAVLRRCPPNSASNVRSISEARRSR